MQVITMSACMYVCIYVHTCVCVCVCVRACVRACVFACMHICSRSHHQLLENICPIGQVLILKICFTFTCYVIVV